MTKKIFYGWWIVLACFFIAIYVGGIVFFGFTAFFEPLIEEFGWSYTQISFAASLRGLQMGILAPLIGFLVDRFGPRRLILYGTITIGLGLILLSLTRSLIMFYGSFLFLAFGAGGCTSVATMSAVANWFHRDVGKALGVMVSGFGASGLIILLIVPLIEVYDWRTTLIILGLGMWILGVPLSFVIRNKPEQYGYLPDGRLLDDSIPQHNIQYEKHDQVELSFREALKRRSFLYLTLVELLRMMTLAAVVIHVMPYLSSIGISRPTAGLVAAAIPLFSILGRFGFGWLADAFDKRYVMAIALSLMAMGMLAFCYVQHRWVILIFLLLFSPGFGGVNVLRGAIVREYFGRDFFGKMLGIIMGFASMGGIIGPTLAGYAFDTLGSYHVIWLVFCGAVSVGIIMTFRIKSEYIRAL